MISVEELKVGLLVWWTSERLVDEWSCPCIVICIEDDSVTVKSLDDFREAYLYLSDGEFYEDSLREMRICTIDEVRQYFKEQLRNRSDALTGKRRELKDLEEETSSYKEKVEKFLRDPS